MATYNGEKFIYAQLNSILLQIHSDDEIIICDDNSSDSTLEIVRSFSDNRIKIIKNKTNLGHLKNFEKAISLSSGEYIFLSDQDDLWVDGRYEGMLNFAKSSVKKRKLIFGMFLKINDQGMLLNHESKYEEYPKSRIFFIFKCIIGKTSTYGSTFLIERSLVKYLIPLPSRVDAHDFWFIIISSLFGNVIQYKEICLLRRIHKNNVTPKYRRQIHTVVKSRLNLFISIIHQILRHLYLKLIYLKNSLNKL